MRSRFVWRWFFLAVLVAACAESDPPPPPQFLDVRELPEGVALLDLERPTDARIWLTEHVGGNAELLPLYGAASWRTRVVALRNQPLAPALAAGRTYLVQGEGDVCLRARLGAGRRGTEMGGSLLTNADRAMIEVSISDPSTLNALHRIRLWRVDPNPARLRSVTPRYLEASVPRGTYRAWVSIPTSGARYLVEANTEVQREVVSRAWSSPLEVIRP